LPLTGAGMKPRRHVHLLALAAALAAQAAYAQAQPAKPAEVAPRKAVIGAWGVDATALSKTVKPGDDFYRYVNEGWVKKSKIPDGLPNYDSFAEAYLSTEQRISAIIDETRGGTHKAGAPEQQIADFYRSHADTAKRNALGITPISSYLKTISGAKDRASLARIFAWPWMDSVITGDVTADAEDPKRQIVMVGASGLTMPAREYYLDQTAPYVAFRKAFVEYVAASFRRAGINNAEVRAAKVLAFETEVAKRQWTTEQQRDVVRMNNVMTPAELKSFAPGYPWDLWLAEMRFENQSQLKVTTDTAVRDNAKLFADTPIADLQSYLLFKTLDSWADTLSEPWVQAHFGFHQTALKGISVRRPAELETVSTVNGAFGEELGRIYVAKHFGAADRAQVQELIGYLRDTYRDRITKNPWMDDATRTEALTKLRKITSYIGYPDQWHDRSSVLIKADDLAGNCKRIQEWNRADRLRTLTEGTRTWEFPYAPQEINAGYTPELNSITFPAGILQAPFFDPNADPAVNFGSTAAVIGHEIGHAFDDQGSRSDGDGKIRNWWTPATRAEFEKRTNGLVDQYNQYEAVPGVKVNGRQNLGENIGDLGGLSVAYAAYRKYVDDKEGGKAPVIDGYTGDQRFFMAWAQVWRILITEAEARQRVLSDVHSPGETRANGVVRNVDAWYDAFNVKPDNALYLPPEKRVRIW
jgi:putative endopeptidase